MSCQLDTTIYQAGLPPTYELCRHFHEAGRSDGRREAEDEMATAIVSRLSRHRREDTAAADYFSLPKISAPRDGIGHGYILASCRHDATEK